MCKLSDWFKKAKPVPPATMTKEAVIEELEYDILIHEHWAVKVTQEPEWADSMGDYNWHMRWIEVYQNCIHYLKEGGKL